MFLFLPLDFQMLFLHVEPCLNLIAQDALLLPYDLE
ncbi:hypothetical protein MGSAQ_000245 [marine sediment metagenome]|uniref:Uncharacterized protein n=1 Tax=marine sediment metagenome TaxID=412755 RepID=A0A1B6NY02_9ZZZZ